MKKLFAFTFQKYLFYFPWMLIFIVMIAFMALGEVRFLGYSIYDNTSILVYDANEVLLYLFLDRGILMRFYFPVFLLAGVYLVDRMEGMSYAMLRYQNRTAWGRWLLAISMVFWFVFIFFQILANFFLVYSFFPFKGRRTELSELLGVPNGALASDYLGGAMVKFGLCLLVFLWLYVFLRFLFRKKWPAVAFMLFYIAMNIAHYRMPYIPYLTPWMQYSIVECVHTYEPLGMWLLSLRLVFFGLGSLFSVRNVQFEGKEVVK